MVKLVEKTINVANSVKELSSPYINFDYDREADVMYFNFSKNKKAADTEFLKDNILIRKKGREIIGITILNASKKRN